MTIKPGTLCVVVGAVETPGLLNRFVIVESITRAGERFQPGLCVEETNEPAWMCRSAVTGDLLPAVTGLGRLIQIPRRPIAAAILKPIGGDSPGNEQWFTAAPRSKPATTKGDTIDAREMVRS